MGRQSQAMGWIVTGLVVVLAALTFVIVRSTAQPEPPDLTPVEVTPHSSSAPPQSPSAPPQSPGSGGEPSGADSSTDSDSPGSTTDAEGAPPKRIERSYEPAPNPPREIPDGDDDDDDVGDGEEVEDAGDDDDD